MGRRYGAAVADRYPKNSARRTRSARGRAGRERGERAMNGQESNRKALASWSRRLRHGRMLLLALGVVVATAVGGRASDLCLDYTNGGSFVLKGFKIPGGTSAVQCTASSQLVARS